MFKADLSLAKAPIAKALLWEISGNGLKRPSYLLGTRHVGCAKRLALSAEQKQVMAAVEQVYFELDSKALHQSQSTSAAIQEKTRISKGKGLKEQLTLAQYQFVEDYFGKSELDSLVLRNTDVFSLYNIVAFQIAGKVYDRFCPKSLTSKEKIITKAATDQRLPIFGIETRKDRSDIVGTSSTSKDWVDVLLATIREANSINSNSIIAEPTFQKYIEQDKQYFRQDIREPSGSLNSKITIIDRNKLWLSRMLKAMSQKSTLFAFGNAHLAGSEGLVSLLESKGYKLRPILSGLESQKIDVSNAEQYYEAGRDLESSERLDALDNYDRAIEIWERNGSKKIELAKAYYDRGILKKEYFCGFKSALEDLSRAISLDPNHAVMYLTRGILKLEDLRDYQGALSDFNKFVASDLNPDARLYGYYYRGILKGDYLNDPKGALSDFNTFLATRPQDIEVLLLRGVLKHNKLGDRSGGITDLRRAALLSRNQGDQKELLNRVMAVLKAINVSETP